jgi:putative DNA primase/helicase
MAIDNQKVEELEMQYRKLPDILKSRKIWCGYKKVEFPDEEKGTMRTTKLPFNAVTGSLAKSNDPSTWTTFKMAIRGIAVFGFDGLGIMLGNGLVGTDLDNHADSTGEFPLTDEQFREWTATAVDILGGYAEYSPSGKGVHILNIGHLPEGSMSKGHKVVDGLRRDVEMYDKCRFFTVTGNVIREDDLLEDKSDILKEFYEKYVFVESNDYQNKCAFKYTESGRSFLSDREVIERATAAKNGTKFIDLYYNKNYDLYGGDRSNADQALADMLAYWTNGDAAQIDRLFRASSLIRDKWDRNCKDGMTYGQVTIDKAIRGMTTGYVPPKPRAEYNPVANKRYTANRDTGEIIEEDDTGDNDEEDDGEDHTGFSPVMTLDESNEPIFRVNALKRNNYTFDDVGNAEAFYDIFGHLFHYNTKSKYFMYWTGKTWVEDSLNIINKYLVRLSVIMEKDKQSYVEAYEKAVDEDDEVAIAEAKAKLKAFTANIKYVRSTKGQEAIKKQIACLHEIPVLPTMFNKEEYYLNTDSGVVDLRNGTIIPWDRNLMLSMNTKCKVNLKDEPTLWIKFLHQIFQRGAGEEEKDEKLRAKNLKETEDIIDIIQQIIGLALTGYTREQKLFILYGSGSNGKSTFINLIANKVMGDYAIKMDSSVLLAKDAGTNSNVQFSLANLVGKRLLITSETDDNERMSEKTVKDMTGDDMVNARELYGKGFEYLPQYNVFMCTNNLPIIRGTDFGIWRRIFVIPFVHTFRDAEKDPEMPRKLEAEKDKILGWCIKGYQKYVDNGARLITPSCISDVVNAYKEDMDVVSRFMVKCCHFHEQERESCTDVYSAYKNWAKDNTDFVMKESNFYKNVKSKGFQTITNMDREEIYCGFCLNPAVKAKLKGYDKYGSGYSSGLDFSKGYQRQ